MDNICFQCGNPIDESNGKTMTYMGGFHAQCHNEFENEIIESEKKEAERLLSDQKKSERIKRKLSKSLKPKLWVLIKREIDSSHPWLLEIVDVSKVEGNKVSGREFFDESTAIRHVYDDIGYTGYCDSMSGTISIYIGKKRYLKIYVQDY